nr:ATP-dependent DNA helicase hus2/rqh1-like [Crassostrea gigas]
MKEQCEYLKSCDFTSTFIGRDSSEDIDIINGNFQFLFASPESILSVNKWRDMLVASKHFKLFVVDEAHTVLHWGESEIEMEPFRIWYSKLGEIRSLIQCPVLLITATANRSARMEMQKKFCMIDCHEIIQNPDRENIKLFAHTFKSTVSHGDIFYFLIHLLKKDKELCERILIFCPSIKTCSELFSAFRMKLGHIIKHVDMFHSQTPDTVKERIKEDMSVESGNIRVLVATSAAGMGVNFRSVKYVINYGPLKDMDGFVQQFGRAGRDGGVAMALLLFNGKQCRKLDEDMKTYTQNKETCRRDIILSAYKSKSDPKRLRHMCCDICDVQCDCNSTDCSNFKHPFYKYEFPVCSSDSDNSADDMFDDDSD